MRSSVAGAVLVVSAAVGGVYLGMWYADVDRLSGFSRLATLAPSGWAAASFALLLIGAFALRRRPIAPWLLVAAVVVPLTAIVSGTLVYDPLGTPTDLQLPSGMETP